jgi:group I intron endonuclease
MTIKKTNKELKDEYKLMKFKMGVFQIRNKINNKIYIDSSTNLEKIWNRHRLQLNFGNHPNSVLQKEWNEFGEETFIYEILGEIEETTDVKTDYKKEIKVLEEMFIEERMPFEDKGYNKRPKN